MHGYGDLLNHKSFGVHNLSLKKGVKEAGSSKDRLCKKSFTQKTCFYRGKIYKRFCKNRYRFCRWKVDAEVEEGEAAS